MDLASRELAELSGARGGRHATREETDNTMQFLRVLVDNGERGHGDAGVVGMRGIGMRLKGIAAGSGAVGCERTFVGVR